MEYFSTRDLKRRAKATIRRRMGALLLTAALFIVLNFLLSYLADELTGINAWNREFSRRLRSYMDEIQGLAGTNDLYSLIDRLSMPDISFYSKGVFATVLAVLVYLMSVPLSVGYTFHVLTEARGAETKASSIFFGFRVMWKALAINLLSGLLVALGSILFLIPGIILLLRYSMAIYILIDDPTKGVIQCMRESGFLMRGNKWNYFKLNFSFILWYLLSSLVTGTVGAPLLNIYLTPYINLTTSYFYIDLLPAHNGPDSISF